jgi:hemerythrin superfamily protein
VPQPSLPEPSLPQPSLPTIADRPAAELGGDRSVLVRQRADHVELDRLLHELDGTTGDAQRAVLRRIDRLVFSHAFAEEVVLWPVLRRVLPDGRELTTQVEREHQEVNNLVADLERTADDDPRRPVLLDRLVAVLREDVRDEEDQLFPRLRDRLDDRALRRLGWAWAVVARVSPTRPHPTVARRPPGNALSGLPLSVLDRGRDHLDAHAGWPGARAGSALLARVAGLVERTPAARHGDTPATHR